MPKMYKRKGARRVRKSKPRRKPTGLVNRALGPIPQRYICKMKFAADVSTDANGRLAISLNSIWDPLRSGAVNPDQPYGRDTLASLYNRYRVISAGWRMTAANNGGNIQFGAIPANEVLAPSNFSEVRESPRAKYFVQMAGGPTQLLKGKVYLPSLVGRTKAQYMADDRYQAQFDANPNELAILNLAVAATNGGLIPTGQNINLLLEYTVEWFDIKQLGPS